MKRFLIAVALSCVISGTALAGHIDTCGAPEPAPGETQSPPEDGTGITAAVIETIISLVV